MLENYEHLRISLASISDSVIEETNKTREIKKKLKDDLIDLVSHSQFHGLDRILQRRYLVRLIWLTFFLVSMGLCAYTIVTSFQNYLSFGVNTLIHIVPQDQIPVPAISVCNQNPFITRAANKYIEDYYLNTYNVSLDSYENFDRLISEKKVPNDVDWLFYSSFDPDFNQTLRDSFGFTFEELSAFCSVLQFGCPDLSQFRFFYHAKYGKCVIFNSGLSDNGSNVDLVYQTVDEYGLEMGIFTGEAENPKYFYNGRFDNGIVVMIGDQNSTSLDQEGIFISPGSYAVVVNKKTATKNLPKPYTDCVDSDAVKSKLGNEMRRLGISYDRHNCFTLCKQMIVIEKLGCYDMRYPKLFNSTPCKDKASFEKLKHIELDLNTCQNECPFECETTMINWDISYATFPNRYLYKIINSTNYQPLRRLYTNNTYSYLDVQQAVAGFFVYYDPLVITEITQSPAMTLADLFSNVGGALGLFLGISLLSLVELLEAILVSFENVLKFWSSKPIIVNNTKKMKQTIAEKNINIEISNFVKKELYRSGLFTTLHGVPNILLTKRNYMKIIWILFSLASMSLCIFMIVRAISGYMQFEMTSQIRQVPQENITFPNIVICNPNFMATREAFAYMTEFYRTNFGFNISTMDQFFDYQNVTTFRSFNWAFYQTFSPKFNSTLRRLMGYSLEDMLLKCEFNSKPCNLSWFDWYYHPMFGNCFTFNTGHLNGAQNAYDLLTVEKSNSGLYIELFAGLPDEYYDFYIREWEYNAINIYMTSNGHLPVDKYGRPFKAGSAASIKLYLTHLVNLPAPYSNCQYPHMMQSDLVKNILNANLSYDRYNCQSFCQQVLAYNVSGCYYMQFPNPFNLPVCDTYEGCMKNRESNPSFSICSTLCPAECEQFNYDYDISLSDFPSDNYAYKLLQDNKDSFKRLFQTDNITYDMLKKSVSSFHFYFDEIITTEIIESPSVEFVDLISNIGGIFGLFVGLSVLSFVEIIELTFNLVRVIIKSKRLKRQKDDDVANTYI